MVEMAIINFFFFRNFTRAFLEILQLRCNYQSSQNGQILLISVRKFYKCKFLEIQMIFRRMYE